MAMSSGEGVVVGVRFGEGGMLGVAVDGGLSVKLNSMGGIGTGSMRG